MLELDDIIPPQIPQPEPLVWPWVVAAILVAALATAAVWRARRMKTPTSATSPETTLRASFASLRNALATHQNTADSMPGVVHRWITQTLETHPELSPQTIAALETVRDQVAPHRFLPPARWQTKLNTESIVSALADALAIPNECPQKGDAA